MNLKILYEDNHIVIVLKPAGVLSQAGDIKQPDMVNLLKDYLKKKYNKPGNVYLGLVHRLDINVAGVMVFAKTSKAANRLSEQIRNHEFTKKYLAIAYGEIKEETGELEDYLVKDNKERQAILGNKSNGKLAKLKYSLLGKTKINKKDFSLLDIELITGRFHQIRFQLANMNHPLYGDTKYSDASPNKEFFIGLYAYQIEFLHPTKKEKMVFNLKPTHRYFREFEGLNKINWRTV
ncbi:RluA family pseudouridine synthase [Candidatus Izemoplasma sp. B36]|uniref:RluA family pseudouridine synthase n=1 Tax=Candidatus Izemoplasma sp. B36 TaxID=3242468 RepID=UPI0035574DAB